MQESTKQDEEGDQVFEANDHDVYKRTKCDVNLNKVQAFCTREDEKNHFYDCVEGFFIIQTLTIFNLQSSSIFKMANTEENEDLDKISQMGCLQITLAKFSHL